MDRTVYRVKRDGIEWFVAREGDTEPYWRSELKSNVVALAREQAQNNRPSKLVVHADNGAVQAEFTYDVDGPSSPE